jgi:xanthine dehydrogenase YagS FAD-binding subunit
VSGSRWIAGGTTLIDLMREEVERPSALVDINALDLRNIEASPNELRIGALARMAEVAGHPAVRHAQPLISQALLEGASPQLRNMASIGGNLMQRVRCPYFRQLDAPCNRRNPGTGCAAIVGVQTNHAILGTSASCIATHPSDLAVALVALDAVVRVRGPDGPRSLRVEDLYRLPADSPHLEHTLDAGELIVEIRVPAGTHSKRTAYLKVRDRSSYEFALVSVAAALDLDRGLVRGVRLAAGGVATVPWRLRAVEAALVGERFGPASLERAVRLAANGATTWPGTEYKVELLRRTIVRALEIAEGSA